MHDLQEEGDCDCFLVLLEYWHNLSKTRLSSLSSLGETGPLAEEAEAEFETEAAAGLLEVDPPAVPGLSLNSERSRSICFRLYSSGIHTSLLVRDLFVCDPARLDLFEAFAYAGRASDVTGDEDEGLVGLAEEETFGLAAFIFT